MSGATKISHSSYKTKRDTHYTTHKKYPLKKPTKASMTEVQIMNEKLSVPDSCFCGFHEFSCKWKVPIYEVETVHALNRLIGYAKFINRSYGDVFYRGECRLHPSLLPSVLRGGTNTTRLQHLRSLINKIREDSQLPRDMKIDGFDEVSASLTIEGMLQHYGIKTRFIDVVDNHWVALWMGLNKNEILKQIEQYCHYKQRTIPLGDIAVNKSIDPDSVYQYILLIATPGNMDRINNGIFVSSDFNKIDLRQALPSIFLRPHAQHGLVVCKRPHSGDISNYDMANTVVGIIKIRIDRVAQWIGQGNLLTQDNLFPAPAYDYGYDLLLQKKDLFDTENKIALYI